MNLLYKTPRLFHDGPLHAGETIMLGDGAHHYLKNVMRAETGAFLRLFNGSDGEFTARIEEIGKKTLAVAIQSKIRSQPDSVRPLHLLFTPLKKERMDFLIEKAVELGATHLHPVLTRYTDIRKINEERIKAQIIEAAEQCERLDIPVLFPLSDLFAKLERWGGPFPVFAAIERADAAPLSRAWHETRRGRSAGAAAGASGALTPKAQITGAALLTGPPGGFDDDEKERLATLEHTLPVSLGTAILRSETAALAGLVLLQEGEEPQGGG
ncbi:MAG: RsmE family RNA methyltransferase [Micavibrio sp.]